MILLMQLYPDHLDLNGDSGNLVVLHQRAIWGGLEAKVETLQPGASPRSRPDVLLIGHGSTAAWRQIYAEFARFAPTIEHWMSLGTRVIAVASGFAALHGLLPGLNSSVDRGERKSKFIVEDFEGQRIFGYINSDLALPNLVIQENLIGTMLHGPFLVKNSWFADEILEKINGLNPRARVESAKFDAIEKLERAAKERTEEQV
jgi:CobQ-like glutamine amidotransferase family enzyme